jgi:hypothetical protein
MKKKAFNIFSVFLLGSVYITFFVVQICFNFETPDHSKLAYSPVSKIDLAKNAMHSTHYARFRLNKRFQPKSIQVCNYIKTDPPIRYVTTKRILSYPSKIYPAFALFIHSFRGPPTIPLISNQLYFSI